MDLSYFNSRIKGMRGRLLGPVDFEALFRADSLRGYFDYLASTPYGPYLETSSARFKREDDVVSNALASNMADTFAAVWKIAPDEGRRLLKAVFTIWEVYDIKAILRGLAMNVPREDMLNTLVPAGELNLASLRTLASSKDIQDLIQFLDTWGSSYARPLREGFEAYQRKGTLSEMELRLDIYSIQALLSSLNGDFDNRIIKEVVSLRADTENIMTLFKVVGEGYSQKGVEGFFMQGGERLLLKAFVELAKLNDRRELLERLLAVIRDFDLKAALSGVEPDEVSVIEERFEEAIRKRMHRLSIVEPLSIALAVSFIFMKVREVKNLRVIARGKAFGMPEAELKRLVIYPR